MNLHNDVFSKATTFILEEPNQSFKLELQTLIDNAQQGNISAIQELEDRFNSHVQFGTAGIRGAMCSGTNRMNSVMVAKISYAIAQYFLKTQYSNKQIVLAYDGRLHSKEFSEIACSIFVGYGFRVSLFDEPTPTPVCAYAVRKLGARAGIVITASHNPKNDNGYKLYFENGAQASGEGLHEIESLIIQSPPFAKLNRPTLDQQINSGLRKSVEKAVGENYLQCIQRKQSNKISYPIVYSALHGVGAKYACKGLLDSGFENIKIVKSQEYPDGNFPTIENPNPEHIPTLSESLKLARKEQADLILVNDPDADRLAVAEWDSSKNDFNILTGNQIGVLLAEQIIKEAKEKQHKISVASTIVSSRMLSAMAAHHGISYIETITGFANITRAALEHERATGEQFAFAYEEALGYLSSTCVYDKDGISAAIRMAELWAFLKNNNLRLEDKLESMALTYGIFENTSFSIHTKVDIMDKIRNGSIEFKKLAGEKITLIFDYAKSLHQNLKSNCLIFENKNVGRVAVRPSGTEPKVKFYIELFNKAQTQSDVSSKRKILQEMLKIEIKHIENIFS